MTVGIILDRLFFFQAEDGIRDTSVTGVQTCALPICLHSRPSGTDQLSGLAGQGDRAVSATGDSARPRPRRLTDVWKQIGRASCRERVEDTDGDGRVEQKLK